MSQQENNTARPSSPLEWALFWAGLDVPVFPVYNSVSETVCGCPDGPACRSPGKHPRVSDWRNVATTDERQIKRWWAANPESPVGGVCGNGLYVVDIDGPTGEQSAAGLDLPPTVGCRTGNGRHLYYWYDTDTVEECAAHNAQSPKIGEKIDGRGAGGYVLLPGSPHPTGRVYTLTGDLDHMAELPGWVLEAIKKRPPPTLSNTAANAPKGPATDEENSLFHRELTRFLKRLAAAPEGNRHRVLLGGVRDLAGYNHLQDRYTEDELMSMFQDAVVAAYGDDRELHTVSDAWRHGVQYPHTAFPGADKQPAEPGRAAHRFFFGTAPYGPQDDVMDGLAWGKNAPKKTRGNVLFMLQHDSRWRKLRLWWDTHADKPMVGSRQAKDADYRQLAVWVTAVYGLPEISLSMASECLLMACDMDQHNPLQSWLNAQAWDGVPRLDELAERFRAAPEWVELSRIFLRKTLISMVARAMQPGCKVDTVLVLKGGQGTRKSTACQILGGEWYQVGSSDISKDDALRALCGAWVVEWAELTSTYRSRSQRLKEFVTNRSDTFRHSYGRFHVQHKRTNVFVGTTNDDNFLKDPTGSRRFWVVDVTGDIDTDWLEENRTQLLAEALAAYSAGEQWYLDSETDRRRAAQNEAYADEPDWAEDLEEWLDAQKKWSNGWKISDFLTHVSILNRKYRVAARDIGAYLRHVLGFKKDQKKRWWAVEGEALAKARQEDPRYNGNNRALK